MKYLKLFSVIVLLAVIAGCQIADSGNLKDEPKPPTEPDSVEVRVNVIDDSTSQRITTAKILFNGNIVNTNGLFTETYPKKDVDISVLAEANGYQSMSRARVINTSTDVSITIKLKRATDPVDPDPPTAQFEYEVDGKTVTVDASKSSTPQGSIESYTWEFSDGKTGTGKVADITYDSYGDKSITLKVKNSAGLTDEVTRVAHLEEPADPDPPVANFSWNADGMTVSYDAGQSYAPDGEIISYSWDFDSDGVIDTVTTDPTAEHRFPEPGGEFLTELTVKDDNGLTADITKEVATEYQASDDISHEVSYALDGDRHAVSSTNQTDELIAYGELRPILTDQNPVGMVRLEVKHFTSSQSDQNFSLQFNCGEVNRTFSTITVEDPTGTGWVMSPPIKLDADNFKSKEFCTITAKSEGSGEVVFSDANNSGKMIFTWNIIVNGKVKKVSYKTDFKTNIN